MKNTWVWAAALVSLRVFLLDHCLYFHRVSIYIEVIRSYSQSR